MQFTRALIKLNGPSVKKGRNLKNYTCIRPSTYFKKINIVGRATSHEG